MKELRILQDQAIYEQSLFFLSEKKRKDICLLFIFTNDLNHKF